MVVVMINFDLVFIDIFFIFSEYKFDLKFILDIEVNFDFIVKIEIKM